MIYWEPLLWTMGGVLSAWFVGLPLLVGWITFLEMIKEDSEDD